MSISIELLRFYTQAASPQASRGFAPRENYYISLHLPSRKKLRMKRQFSRINDESPKYTYKKKKKNFKDWGSIVVGIYLSLSLPFRYLGY